MSSVWRRFNSAKSFLCLVPSADTKNNTAYLGTVGGPVSELWAVVGQNLLFRPVGVNVRYSPKQL